MEHRIRCSVLAVRDQSLLMLGGHMPGDMFNWMPPGGGLRGGRESIFDCAEREFFEETGATVKARRVAYIEQYFPGSRNEVNLYMLAESISGEPSLQGEYSEANEWIAEVRWMTRNDMEKIEVRPEFLNKRFWDDLAAGFTAPIDIGATGPGVGLG